MFRTSFILRAIMCLSGLCLVTLAGNTKAVAAARPLRMVYMCDTEEQIVIANADGSNAHVIERSATFYLNPKWSPDGQYISFFERGTESQGMELDRVSPNGKNFYAMKFFDEGHYVYNYAWSSDSQKLLLAQSFRTVVVDVKGRLLQTLEDTLVKDDKIPYLTSATWSPDGKFIAYFLTSEPDVQESGSKNDKTQLWVADADLRNAHMLSEHIGGRWRGIQWSPNGQTIAFYGAPEVNRQYSNKYLLDSVPHIYLINVDGSGERRLTSTDAPEIGMTWSPDSVKIAFRALRVENSGNYWSGTYVIDADGTNDHMIVTGDFQDSAGWVSWSPDGQHIAVAKGGPNGYVFLINPDGSGIVNVTSGEDSRLDCGVVSWEPLPK